MPVKVTLVTHPCLFKAIYIADEDVNGGIPTEVYDLPDCLEDGTPVTSHTALAAELALCNLSEHDLERFALAELPHDSTTVRGRGLILASALLDAWFSADGG